MGSIRETPQLLFLLIALGLIQGCGRGHASEVPTPAEQPFETTSRSRPADVQIELNAEPGDLTVEFDIRVRFNVGIANARVLMNEVVPSDYDEVKPVTIFEVRRHYVAQALQRGEVLWEGDAEIWQEMTFSRRVSVASDTLHVTSVLVTGDPEGPITEDGLDKGAGYIAFAIKPDTIISNSDGYAARRAEIAYELSRRGFPEFADVMLYGDPEERLKARNALYHQDKKLAWIFSHPTETPRARVDTITAPDGTRLPVQVIPDFMLDQLPDSLRKHYNNHSAALEQYYDRLRREQRARSDSSRVILEFPLGITYNDVPDSLMIRPPYDAALTEEERKTLHQEALRAIRDWLKAQEK